MQFVLINHLYDQPGFQAIIAIGEFFWESELYVGILLFGGGLVP